MGFIGKTLKAGVGVGALAAGIGAWAVAPRPAAARRSFGHDGFPDVAFAHRGLHDAGSGLPAKDTAAAAEYVELARSMAIRAGFATKTTQGTVAPENSVAAFAAACEAGFGIELDVQLSADGEVVVLHDATLQRVAGDSRAVRELTYAQLEQIPLFPEDDSSTSAR
jgi:glycerophosphoryl diester phosphodiesterase